MCWINFDAGDYLKSSINASILSDFNIEIDHQKFSDSADSSEVNACIEAYNSDSSISAVFIPDKIPQKFGALKSKIENKKDINCTNNLNFAALASRKHKILFYPLNVAAWLEIIKFHYSNLVGKRITVICDMPDQTNHGSDHWTTKQLAINLFLSLTKENATWKLICKHFHLNRNKSWSRIFSDWSKILNPSQILKRFNLKIVIFDNNKIDVR